MRQTQEERNPQPTRDTGTALPGVLLQASTHGQLSALQQSMEAAAAARALQAAGNGPPADYSLDDTGNARRFCDKFGCDLHYNYTQKSWMVWDGRIWRQDETARVKQLCDAMLDEMEQQALALPATALAQEAHSFIRKSRSSRAKDNLLTEAQHLPGISCTDADFDNAPWLLNLPNGTMRLNPQLLRPHNRRLRLTRLAGAGYDPEARAPVWQAFLHSVTGGDAELQTYLQTMVGYMLTGSTREQCLFFLYGDGSNGKTTFLDVLADLLGSYAMNAQSETLTARRSGDAPRTDIARLKGARLVTISECPADVWLDEALVKQLTGGDTVTARHLYGREFEYRPEFKLIMATNHAPRIRGTDAGIWRRIRLVPFTHTIPEAEQDLQLPDKLHAELPGILNWALEGLRLWLKNSEGARRRGLPPCRAVDTATAAYRGEQDRLRDFLESCTAPAPGSTVPAGVLYQVYRTWCAENGERYPMTGNKFGREAGKTLKRQKTRTSTEYLDTRLSDEGSRLLEQFSGTAPFHSRSGPPLYPQSAVKALPTTLKS